MKTLTPYKKRLKKIKAELPKWLKAIPESASHGSGTYEQRLWRLTSDFVRIRDWYKYNKRTVDGKWLENWDEGQAGHYISYSKCKNLFKFDPINIHMQSAKSNMLSSASDGYIFGEELKRRYGQKILEKINKENLAHADQFYTDKNVEELIKLRLKEFKTLEEIPMYVIRASELLDEYENEM